MVSYEVSIGLIIITVILLAGSMNLSTIVEKQSGWIWNWNVFGGAGLKNVILLPVMVVAMGMFFISALAETNRPPFDLPEARSNSWPAIRSSTAPRRTCCSWWPSIRTSS